MSIWYNILTSLQSEIAPVLQPFNLTSVIRRRPVWLQNDPTKIVIIAPYDGEEVEAQDFTGNTTYIYPTIVTLVWPDNRNNAIDLDAEEYLDVREAIRNKIYYPLLGLTVYDVNMLTTEPYGLPEQNRNYSTTSWVMRFKSLEQRRSF